jgi:tetratricopeptide (TPR) repeat protein
LHERRIAKAIEHNQIPEQDIEDPSMIGYLYSKQGKLADAEQIPLRALNGKEKALGIEHTSTLDTVNNLGLLYIYQGKLVEGEQMLLRALIGTEQTMAV